jgi:hypothetical protein
MARLGWQKDKKWRQLWPRERGEEQKLRGGIPNQNTLVNKACVTGDFSVLQSDEA